MEPAFHGANVLGRAWRKATIMARWNKNNHDKHAPGASIDMKPLSWRKSWPLSISKSGSAGEPPAASARLARRWLVGDLCAPARRSNWWARPPAARSGCARRRAGPGLADIAFAVGPGGYALIRADGRHRGPQSCARPQAGGARCGRPGRAATGAAPLQSRAGCDVPSHRRRRGTLSGPQISGPPVQRRAHFACPLRAPAASASKPEDPGQIMSQISARLASVRSRIAAAAGGRSA